MIRLQKIARIAILTALVLCWLTFMNQVGRLNLFFRDQTVEDIRHDSGYAWVANLDQPKLAIGYELPVTVYENDKPLVRSWQTTTEMIQSNGAGQFMIWENGEICFATTDNSNPIENGRIYRVRYPLILENKVAKIIYAIASLIILFGLLVFSKPILNASMTVLRTLHSNWKYLGLILLAILPFVACAVKYLINQPLWGDEIYTLKNYVFSEKWYEPVLIYDFPNNHVFFNLFLSIYFRVMGIQPYCEVVLQPQRVRFFLLIFSVFTLILTAFSLKKVHPVAGILGAFLLSVTLPFYAWTTQIRGYGFSIFLVSALMAFYASILDTPAKWKFYVFSGLSTALVYVMPSNVLLLIAFGALVLLDGICRALKKRTADLQLKMIASLLLAALLSLILYYPILPQMARIYLSSGSGIKSDLIYFLQVGVRSSLMEIFRSVFLAQPMLLICLIVGIGVAILNKKFRKNYPIQLVWLIISYFLIWILFFISTKSVPFSRNHLLILPLVLGIATVLIWNISTILIARRLKIISGALLYLVLTLSFVLKAQKSFSTAPIYERMTLKELDRPYFLSAQRDLNPLMDSLITSKSSEELIIFGNPSEYYLYETCECYDQRCYSDEVGATAQEVIRQAEPYLLLETNWIGIEPPSAREPYVSQCKASDFSFDAFYKIYLCNQ